MFPLFVLWSVNSVSFVRSCNQWLLDVVQVCSLFLYQERRILKDLDALNMSLCCVLTWCN
jgi:hypothetical protein